MNPTQTLEDLKNAWNPDRALGGTDEMLRQCRLADAQAVWASRRAALEADIASARGTMEHYRKLTYCDLTRGGREFDRMSRREKTLLVEGVGLAGRQPTRPTHFKDWQNAYRHDYLPALADYQAFRDKEAEFQRKYRKRRNALAPLLQDAEQLRQLARTNVRQCTGTFVTPRTMTPLTPEMDEEKELNARVLDLKARMLGFGCSIPMANTFIGGIQSEINNPYQKWASFVGRARFQIRSGRACSTSGAAALRADFEEAISDSFGSRPAMQACLATAREKRIVGDLEAFFIALDLLDKKIAAAGRQVAACDRTAAREAISQAVRLLDRLPCDRLRSAGSRNDQLYALSKQISKPECGAAPDKLQVVYRVSGSGFIPHYAGSSYFTQGHHDVLVTLDEPPTETSLNTVLKEALERYKKDPCDIDIPAIPGLSKTPVVWMSGPQVEFVLGPGPNIERHLLEDTWRHDDGKGNPSLSELRRAACG